MQEEKRPGAHHSDRATECVLVGTLPHSTRLPHTQRSRNLPVRLIGWRVTRWLAVEAVEVRHG